MEASVERQTRWRGQPDTSRRRLGWLVAVSVLLHTPLTPLAALLGLLSLLKVPDEPAPAESLNAIPVALLSAEELEQMGALAGPEPSPTPEAPAPAMTATEEELGALFDDEPPEPDPPPKPAPVRRADAGSAEAADAAAKRPVEAPDGGGPAGDAGREDTVADPGALAGAASSVTDPNANIKLLLLNDRIQGQPLGARIGRIVARLPQWRSFFGPAGLDPIRDISRIYVAGPQFRVSADVIAVIEHKVPLAKMRAAIDSIVQREPKGEWLSTKVPAARARADRAERTFVLPSPNIVVMVPPKLTEEAVDKGRSLSFPRVSDDAALVAFLATPWRALLGLNVPLTVPKSIASVMIKVTPAADGGASIRIQALDESPEAASEHAELLMRGINLATQRDMGPLGFLVGAQKLQLIEPVKLTARGKHIEGTARVTPRQLDRILNFAEGWLDMLERPRTPPPPAITASGDRASGAPPSPSSEVRPRERNDGTEVIRP